jgi:hypothetical protein
MSLDQDNRVVNPEPIVIRLGGRDYRLRWITAGEALRFATIPASDLSRSIDAMADLFEPPAPDIRSLPLYAFLLLVDAIGRGLRQQNPQRTTLAN